MPDRNWLDALDRIRLIDKGPIRERPGKRTGCRGHVRAQQPEWTLWRGKIRDEQSDEGLFPLLTVPEASVLAVRHIQMRDSIMHTAVLSAEQRMLTSFHHRPGCGIA